MLKIIDSKLPYFDDRAEETTIDTLVIHSMYAKGTNNELDEKNCIRLLEQHKVATHYLIGRRGRIFRLVDEVKRAWHAGQSKMPFSDDQREGVNQFSIGVELVGYEDTAFTKSQYRSLCALTAEISSRHPIRAIVGHSDIAPGRKSDPGEGFRWASFMRELKKHGVDIAQFRLLNRTQES